MSNTFEFEKWCEEYELEEDTVQLLKNKGFKSYKSISVMDEDMLAKHFKALSPGQFVLLQQGVQLLRLPKEPVQRPPPPPPIPPPNMDNGDEQVNTIPRPTATGEQQPPLSMASHPISANDILALWKNLTESTEAPQASAVPEPPTDPFGFGSGPYKGKKLRKLRDYITNLAFMDPSYDGDDTMTIGGVTFDVSKNKKLPMDKVKMCHYMEGALRILREMIVEDNISATQIVHHINYLIQIACFMQTKVWKRVLNYDTIYRREQHQHGFAWGTGSAVLTNQLQEPETHNTIHGKQPSQASPLPSNTQQQAKKPKSIINPATRKPVCGRHNGRFGCNGHNCDYDHVCKMCFAGDHTAQFHYEQENKTTPTKNM